MPAVSTSVKAASRRKEKHLSPQELKDIDHKRLKGELSCAECRRLKLRCDKKVPCSSCSRRGCTSICPCGTLEAGTGTRFILASTDQLHEKINMMSSRIRALEDALAILQATASSERHPLLEDELLKIKFGSEALHSEDDSESSPLYLSSSNRPVEIPEFEALGTLTLGEEGEMKYFGRSAGSETLILAGQQYVDTSSDEEEEESAHKGNPVSESGPSPAAGSPSIPSFGEEGKDTVPPEVYALALDYGQGRPSNLRSSSLSTVVDLLTHLPSRSRAEALAQLYIDHGSLFFRAMKKSELFNSILPLVYSTTVQIPMKSSVLGMNSLNSNVRASECQNGSSNATLVDSALPLNLKCFNLPSPHLLSTVFFIFALGSFFDLSSSVKKYVSESEMWFELGRKALTCSRGIIQDDNDPAGSTETPGRIPTVFAAPPSSAEDTVRALGLMATYCSMSGKKYARDSAWYGMSLAAKVAQGSGMHRDPARWHMDPTTVQRRRNLWWEVCTSDISHSVALGRPPSIHLSFVDCEFPTDEEATLSDTGEEVMGFWRMKYTFARESFMPVISTTLTAKSPTYSTIMDLDRKVRELTLPPGFKPYVSLHEDGPTIYYNSHLALRDFYASQHRTVTMLYLHRSFFAHAMLTHPSNPLMSPFALSFLAAYRAASVIIKAAAHLYDRCSTLVPRVWFLTYHVFSAAVTVGTVVKRSPNSSIAKSALNDLGQALDLFEKCASSSTRNKIACALLRKLKEKADRAYSEYLARPKDTVKPSTSKTTSIFPSTDLSSLLSASRGELNPSLFTKSREDENELAIWGGQTRVARLHHHGTGDRKEKSKARRTDSLGSGAGSMSAGFLGSDSSSPTVLTSSPTPIASSSTPLSDGNLKVNFDSSLLAASPPFSDASWNDAIDAQMNFDANLDLSLDSMLTRVPTPMSSVDSRFQTQMSSVTPSQSTSASSMDVSMADLADTGFEFDFGGFGVGAGTSGNQGLFMDMVLEDIAPVGPGISDAPGNSSLNDGPTDSATFSASHASASETQSALMQYLSGTAQTAQGDGPSFLGTFGPSWGASANVESSEREQFQTGNTSNFTTEEMYRQFMNYLALKQKQPSPSASGHGPGAMAPQMQDSFAPTNPTFTQIDGNSAIPTEQDYRLFLESQSGSPSGVDVGAEMPMMNHGQSENNDDLFSGWNMSPGDTGWAAFMSDPAMST